MTLLRSGVERSTVSKTLKDKGKWLAIEENPESTVMSRSTSNRRTGSRSAVTAAEPPQSSPSSQPSPRDPASPVFPVQQSPRWSTLEKLVLEWARERASSGEHLSDHLLKERAKIVAASLNIGESQFKPSQAWVERFMVRAGIASGCFIQQFTDMPPADTVYPLASPQEAMSSSSSSASSFFEGDEHEHSSGSPSDVPQYAQYAHARSASASSFPVSMTLAPTKQNSQPTRPPLVSHATHPGTTFSPMTASTSSHLGFADRGSINPSASFDTLSFGATPDLTNHHSGALVDPMLAMGPMPLQTHWQSQNTLPRRATISLPDGSGQSGSASTYQPASPLISVSQAQEAIGCLKSFLMQQAQSGVSSSHTLQALMDLEAQLSSSTSQPTAWQQYRSGPPQLMEPVPHRPIGLSALQNDGRFTPYPAPR